MVDRIKLIEGNKNEEYILPERKYIFDSDDGTPIIN